MLAKISRLDGSGVSTEEVPTELADLILSYPEEGGDLQNLKSGMELMLSDPLLAIRSCELCSQWWFDQDTGKVVRINGQNLRRPAHALPACRTSAGCRKGTPEKSRAFNLKNQKAFEHWQQWRHVGCPDPQDAIVRRNWMIFGTMVERYGLQRVRKSVSRTNVRG